MKKFRILPTLFLALMLMMAVPAGAEEVTYDLTDSTSVVEDYIVQDENYLNQEYEVFTYGQAGDDSTADAQYIIAEDGCVMISFPGRSGEESVVEYSFADYDAKVIPTEANVTYTITDADGNHAVTYRINDDGSITVSIPDTLEHEGVGEYVIQDDEEQLIVADACVTYVLEGADGNADVIYAVNEDGSVTIQFSEEAASAYMENMIDYTIAEENETIDYSVIVGE